MQSVRRLLGVRAFLPADLQRLASLDCRPRIVSDDRYSTSCKRPCCNGLNRKNLANASHRFRFRGVKRFHLAAKHRASRHDRELHSGHSRIDAKYRRAVRLRMAFPSRRLSPNDVEIIRILQRHRIQIRDRLFCGIRNKLAVSQKILSRSMQHSSVLRHAGIRVHVPACRRRGDKHFSGRCTRSSHRQPATRYASAASRTMVVDIGIRGRLFHADHFPVNTQLLSENHRQRRHDSLAHLRFFQDQRHAVVRRNMHPRVKRIRSLLLLFLSGVLRHSLSEMETDQQSGTGDGSCFQELATV